MEDDSFHEPVYADPNPAARAIVRQDIELMRMNINAYHAPTQFTVESWAGSCTLPALALAIEVPGHHFPAVFRMLVEEAGIDPNTPYEIEDHAQGAPICTNTLTHLLARWDPSKSDSCRDTVLVVLLLNGVDASAPALFETPSALAAASGQSLIAFALWQELPCPVPINFVKDLIWRGHARFRNSDPAGLFVTFVELVLWDSTYRLSAIVYFL